MPTSNLSRITRMTPEQLAQLVVPMNQCRGTSGLAGYERDMIAEAGGVVEDDPDAPFGWRWAVEPTLT